LLNPLVASPYLSLFDFIGDVVVDADNPKRFTVYTNTTYMLAEAALSSLALLPEYVYDPEATFRPFTVADLQNDSIANLRKADLQAFAEKFQRSEPTAVTGCGPYALTEWKSGESILLQKKKNWWGTPLAEKHLTLKANPAELLYKIIPDNTAALTALKDGQLDVMSEIEPLSFIELQQNNYVKDKINLYTPPYLSYYYIALNGNTPALADVRVRKALAELTDVDQIIQSAMHGLAQRVNGPIHPSNLYYDHSLPLIPFNTENVKLLLEEASWRDSDGDGILDKLINGNKESLSLRFLYSTGNQTGEAVALLLQQAAAQVGVGIQIEGKVFGEAVKAYRGRDYDLAYFLWSNMPGPPDLKQIWHTDSDTPTGANRTGFGDSASDALIDSIRTTLVEEKQKDLYLRIQRRIYAEQPYIFLYAPLERIAINNRFKAGTSALRPGFSVRHFQLQPSIVNY
jgi:peptide/nickel transport system substrate-binding protein